MTKTTGFFGGSFDPIHFGHISLALHLLEKYNLTQILFCPAFCSPFKLEKPPHASPAHRLAMLQLALEDIPSFAYSSLELNNPQPSFTIDTIKSLNIKNIRLILSEESPRHLPRWKNTEELVRLAPPLIGPVTTPISSTLIRERLKKNLYCGHLLPSKTYNYIQTHRLYISPPL